MRGRQLESLHNIQMLRAFAAMVVVMHHLLPHYQAMGGDLYIIKSISEWGFIGVDIFFVISGFIMAYTTFNKKRGLKSAKIFIKHRLFRIYLGYLPFFFVMLIALYYTNTLKLDKLDIIGSLLLINADMFKLVLPVSWSLSYELYFYILFLFTLFFSVKRLYILIPSFILIIAILVMMVSLDLGVSDSFFYSPFLLEFFAGVLLYMFREALMRYWMIPIVVVIAIVAYGYGITHESKNGLYRVFSFGTGALSIVLLVLLLERKRIYRANRFLEQLGDASYTIYLSHLILIQIFYVSGLRGFFTSENYIIPLIGWIVMISIVILFSMVYYKKIERPIYQKAIRL